MWAASRLAIFAGAIRTAGAVSLQSSESDLGEWPWRRRGRRGQQQDQQANSSAPIMYRQPLGNIEDVQYISEIDINGQKIKGIMDTGSFELVVFPVSCATCGTAAKYDPKQSKSHKNTENVVVQAYGSGQLLTTAAEDYIGVGPFAKHQQSFWEVTFAMMPVLAQASFESIIGVGPPDSAVNGTSMPTMLDLMGMTMFSVCLGREPLSLGYFVWNDTSAIDRPQDFIQLQVVSQATWSVELTNARLAGTTQSGSNGQPLMIGCHAGESCTALIDSGTSLLMLPMATVDHLIEAVGKLNANCTNMHELPYLAFELDGKMFTLPPDTYIGEVAESKKEEDKEGVEKASGDSTSQFLIASGLARLRTWQRPGYVCQLAVMEGNMKSALGATWILGMPFFRNYYTTFNLQKGHRSISVAPANDDCTPKSTEEKGVSMAKTQMMYRHRIDPDKVLAPRLGNVTSKI